MRLRRLELHGYKTFASRTEFVFNSGITAIVGPNGSGKSNLADAIRWVLGEQSYSVLRGKRTEDMIYAGSDHRPQAGMAQATLIFDNSDGWLPLDFAEVSIGRRAYRSGENEYFLNGSHVRLKEITEVLAASGLAERTYAVVGQGLIDTALSLRSEERRLLIEEAAGISLYRAKREEALRRLEDTRHNMERASDILAEITPRLRQLERQAQRASEHARIQAELSGLLRTWYGYQIGQAQAAWQRAQAEAEDAAGALDRARRAAADLGNRLTALREDAVALRARLRDLAGEEAQLQAAHDRAERERAVQAERLVLLRAQREEAEAEIAALDAQRQAQAELLAAAEVELPQWEAARTEAEAAALATRAELAAYQSGRDALQEKREQARNRLAQLAIAVAERRAQAAHFDAYRADLARQLQGTHSLWHETRAALAAQTPTLHRSLADDEARLAAANVRLAASTAAITQAEAALAQVTVRLAEARAEEARLAERRQWLAQQTAASVSPAGGAAGEAVVAAARASRVRGVWGLAGQLLRPAAGLERAIAAALGPDNDAVIVNTWHDARTALELAPAGSRLTLLPLAELRPPVPLTLLLGLKSHALPPGVVGVAAHYVKAERALRLAVDWLLGRTLIVEDLEAARRWLPQLPPGSQAVTLAGEVLRAGGALTAGAAGLDGRADTAHLRERETQALADAEVHARHLREQAEASQREQTLQLEALRQEQAQAAHQVAEAEEALRAARARTQERSETLSRLARDEAHQRERVSELEAEIAGLDERLAALQREIESLEAERIGAEEDLSALAPSPSPALQERGVFDPSAQAWGEEGRGEGEGLVEWALELERAAAMAQQAYQNQTHGLTTLHRTLADLDARQAAQVKRDQRLATEEEASARALAAAEGQWAMGSEQWAVLEASIQPTRAGLAELETRLAEIEAGEAAARRALAVAEERYAQAHLKAAERQSELAALQRQASEELTTVAGGQWSADSELTTDDWPLTTDVLPEGVEAALSERRARLRRLGPINPEALSEYTEVQSRQAFLSRELADLEAASTQLQHVIAELDTLTQRDFRRTFDTVNTEFKALFTRLFGGGAARLVPTDADDPAHSGIEVMARPPGRRQQPLALLSGGERALTATALLFAILKVSPTPFCVLDEVDAMLDEANIGRFRELLQELATTVQCIVVTHNRGTVEAADTVYGISLTSEGTSQVISLKLEA